MNLLASVGDVHGVVWLLILLVGLAFLGAGVLLLTRREYVGAAVAVVLGVIVLVLAL